MEFLSQEGVEFEEKDVSRDPEALDEFYKLGIRSTPAVFIDGKVHLGFDPDALRAALAE